MNKQLEKLTTELSKEILAFQGMTRMDYVRENIEQILSNNGDVNNGVRNFKLLAKDLNDYIKELPENLAVNLRTINNLAMAIIEFKEEDMPLSSDKVSNIDTDETNVTEYYIPANIQI